MPDNVIDPIKAACTRLDAYYARLNHDPETQAEKREINAYYNELSRQRRAKS